MMDKDKNGNLTFEELKEGLQYIGQAVAEPDVQMLLEAVSSLTMLFKLLKLQTFSPLGNWYELWFIIPNPKHT